MSEAPTPTDAPIPAGLVGAETCLEIVFPDKSTRPSLRWLRELQHKRLIPFRKIGKLVFFDPVEARRALDRELPSTRAEPQSPPVPAALPTPRPWNPIGGAGGKTKALDLMSVGPALTAGKSQERHWRYCQQWAGRWASPGRKCPRNASHPPPHGSPVCPRAFLPAI